VEFEPEILDDKELNSVMISLISLYFKCFILIARASLGDQVNLYVGVGGLELD